MKTQNPKDTIASAWGEDVSDLTSEKKLDLNYSVLSEIDGDNDIYMVNSFLSYFAMNLFHT